ncbi:hypothetical protein DAPPUDRAFT_315933 [Daphnia pulex]|uniref:3-oxo-5alpha-steroid 4-dehydrogenase (NADP(+)) n=1 Tax=Daphnia pulex TaxID=6669 RepID=E9GC28_DAPPU|nr:hypothetical protein DAPPUDRAFT_315933 [Daphnia pulex]|eukprot:EFX82925.1 hypothetical protein DAPPUDRAFT_315933 [Daphnia pulex]
MSSKTLAADKFIVDYLHPLFGAKNDSEMFSQMVWISFLYTLSVIFTMYILPAPYGRYSSSKFGFLIPGKFAWMTQECPALIVPVILLLTTSATCWHSTANKILLLGFIIHYVQRAFIFPLSMSNPMKSSPFLVYISALSFCLFNGFMQGHYLLNYHQYDDKWTASPQFITGIIIFYTGMAINVQSDQLLIHLRKPGETGYKIPTGGLFDYITGANFFGEIVEWTGFAIASCSPPATIFAFFSAAYLGMRAWHHHNYYLSKFEDYPRTRKIIIPFLF